MSITDKAIRKLHDIRIEKGISAARAGAAICVLKRQLIYLETGHCTMTLPQFMHLCKAYGVMASEVLRECGK